MGDSDIYKELIYIKQNNLKETYISEFKNKYLEKYLIYGQTRILDENITNKDSKICINLNGTYGYVGLSDEGEYFISNYDKSYSKKLDLYLGKYPNISKLFYILLGIVIGLTPAIINIFI